MLTPLDYEKLEKLAIKLYEDLEIDLIEAIANRIAKVGYANTVAYNSAEILAQMGYLYNDVVETVASFNNGKAEEIYQIFEQAGIQSLFRDSAYYNEKVAKSHLLNDNMKSILQASTSRTSYNLERLTNTTVQTSQQFFIDSINKAYLEVITGVDSYSGSIGKILKNVPNGTQVNYGNGVYRSIESVARTNILTSVSQTTGQLQLMRAEEYGNDLMELTAHIDSRPSHAEWQGKIVSLSGADGYLSLDDIGYGDVRGFKGINCRHDWHPYIEGGAKAWTDKELKELENAKVTYKGQKIGYYNATQIQRRLERDIREHKKVVKSYDSFLKENKDDNISSMLKIEKAKLRQSRENLEAFLSETGLKNSPSRLEI